jgi:hypothetical protein
MKKLHLILIPIFIIFFQAQSAFAQSLYFSVPKETRIGETFEISVNLDSEEPVNSIDLVINFPENLLQFSGYRENDTSIRLWINTPREQEGKVHLSGIIPGGVFGLYDESSKSYKDIPLTKLIFTPVKAGLAEFSLEKGEILKNDGKGTKLDFSSLSSRVEIGVGDGQRQGELDLVPPLPFEVVFINTDKIEETPSVVLFQATDIGSGISRYEIKVGSRDWEEGISPKEVKRGMFGKKVYVRAYDFSGNFTEAEGKIPGKASEIVFVLLGLLVLGFLRFRVVKYKL